MIQMMLLCFATNVSLSSLSRSSVEVMLLRLHYNSKIPYIEFDEILDYSRLTLPLFAHDILLCHLHEPNIWLIHVYSMYMQIELIESGVRISYENQVWVIENQIKIDLYIYETKVVIPNRSPNSKSSNNMIRILKEICWKDPNPNPNLEIAKLNFAFT